MWKTLLFPLVFFAVIFTPAIIVALNVGSLIALVAYLLYSKIRGISFHHHYASNNAV